MGEKTPAVCLTARLSGFRHFYRQLLPCNANASADHIMLSATRESMEEHRQSHPDDSTDAFVHHFATIHESRDAVISII